MSLSAVPVSRRERKKQATRQALHEAALNLVETSGLANVTIEDITEQADVATRTFFNYFSSKEDAVIGRDPELVDELLACLYLRPLDEPAFESLRFVLTASYVARAIEPDRIRRRIRIIKSDPILHSRLAGQFERVEQRLIAAVAERSGTDPAIDLEPSLLVLSALAASRAALMHWCDLGSSSSLEVSFGDAFERTGAGLATPYQYSSPAHSAAGTPLKKF